MKALASVNFSGVDKAMSALASKLDSAVLGKALEKGGALIQRQAKINVHVISQDLQKSIAVSDWYKDGGTVAVRIGTNVVYSAIEELGGEIEITPKMRTYMHTVLDMHPRASTTHVIRQPHPYLKPAFYSKKDAAFELVLEELKKEL